MVNEKFYLKIRMVNFQVQFKVNFAPSGFVIAETFGLRLHSYINKS